ncbi:hypothetical protein BJV82DRAFT_506912 [Fennellomyces sp. T-0311]|nr:hypothetical protein BJV82DRAFT_506912 [Fennellomyces sp. T-0311]
MTQEATKFVDLVNYVLTAFHLLCQSPLAAVINHERSFFIEYIVPGLLALSKTSDLFDFYWCEYEMQAMKETHMQDNDFNLLKTPRRYLDALGKMTMNSEMEVVVVEASSGIVSENVSHTIGDTLKSLECATASLAGQASKYRHASFATFQKLQVFSIHVIKNKMTLSTTTIHDAYTWKRMDLRTTDIPTKWCDRISLIRYFELLATLMVGLNIHVHHLI